MTLPEPVFAHLRHLTDERGLFEHALHTDPRPEHGYCVDDAARAVVVLCRAADPDADDLLVRHLRFVLDAVADDGRCHNRLGQDGAWLDEPGEGDWWGRAAWALGTAAADPRLEAVLRGRAAAAFERLASRRPPHRRALALAALGAAELDTAAARALLADAAAVVRGNDGTIGATAGPSARTDAGPPSWPEPRLTYDNARLPDALLAAGSVLDRPDLVETGLAWLRFLVDHETVGGHFSVAPVGGRTVGLRGPAFDQQPLELAALADACARAHDLTGDPAWADAVARTWAWFCGDNDVGVAMYDTRTGAGYDGLVPGGRNDNRGAESTLAALSVLLQARRRERVMAIDVVHYPDQTLQPARDRVVARLFMPSADLAHGQHALDLVTRVMSLPEDEVDRLVTDVMRQFTHFHGNLRTTLLEHAHPLIPRGSNISEARAIVLGAAFTAEYAVEGAALCNPSVVPHPDQSDLRGGELRVAVSLRAIGEGHLSSVEFATAVIGEGWTFVPRAEPPVVGTVTSASIPWELFAALARNGDEHDELTVAVLNNAPDRVRAVDVEQILDELHPDLLLHPSAHRRAAVLRHAARSSYFVSFDPRTRLDQRILMPAVEDESHGLEDARFTLFHDAEGSTQYRATYTAYDGRAIRLRMLTSPDLATFQSTPLAGPGASNKGMALFPALVGGRFAALTRHDGARNGVAFSDDGLIWEEPAIIGEPSTSTWAIRQLGNAGSPLEIDEGWLVLTHGVGVMRVYTLGAMLLDRDDPTRVLARLDAPWLTPHPHHGGYVPNVVYSCGGIVHQRRLFVPYGVGDEHISVASVAVDDLLGAMHPEPQRPQPTRLRISRRGHTSRS